MAARSRRRAPILRRQAEVVLDEERRATEQRLEGKHFVREGFFLPLPQGN